MSGAADVLELLGDLADADRRWILDQLAPDAKAKLAERVKLAHENPVAFAGLPAGGAKATSDAARELEECVARIAAADAAGMMAVLNDEPTWLVAAVLQLHDWPWQKMFLQRASSSVRIDVAQLQRGTPPLGSVAASWLLRELSARLGALPSEMQAAPGMSRRDGQADSGFALLLARATGKVGRR